MSREGLRPDLLAAGAPVSEPACGPCAGIGHVPAAGGREPPRLQPQLRRSQRRPGRPGLASGRPLTAAPAALTGVTTDPRTRAARRPSASYPEHPSSPPMLSSFLPATESEAAATVVLAGPNIKDVPALRALSRRCLGRRCCSSSATRSRPTTSRLQGRPPSSCAPNVSAIAEFISVQRARDSEFVARSGAAGTGVLLGGEIYGQGSSREVAVLGPAAPGRARRPREELRPASTARTSSTGASVPLEFDKRGGLRKRSSATTCCASTISATRSWPGGRSR